MRAFTFILAGFLALSSLASGALAEKLRIATEGAYPPFNFVDQTGKVQGFDVDIARALCEKMRVECEIVAQDWDGILPGLLAKKYDAVFASVSITPERQKIVAFTDAYYRTLPQFVGKKGDIPVDLSPETLQGKTLGAQASTIHANYLAKYYPRSNIKFYATQDEANADLAAGRLYLVLADKVMMWDWLEKKNGKSCCVFVGEPLISNESNNLGVAGALRPEDVELKARFNKALKEIIEDGTYKKVNDRYFPFSIL